MVPSWPSATADGSVSGGATFWPSSRASEKATRGLPALMLEMALNASSAPAASEPIFHSGAFGSVMEGSFRTNGRRHSTTDHTDDTDKNQSPKRQRGLPSLSVSSV